MTSITNTHSTLALLNSMNTLPEELLPEIFSYLPFDDLLNTRLVNPQFNSVLEKHSYLITNAKIDKRNKEISTIFHAAQNDIVADVNLGEDP